MPQTKMFRDRVVSMEQTLEGGEKNLELLKTICLEAFPEFQYRGHALDHEKDTFVMTLEAPDGRRKTVGWTRMVLFDAERIPAIATDPASPLKERLLAFLRSRAARPEIVVTFRHMEEGWKDTQEPRREKKRGRRGRPQARGERPQMQSPRLEQRGPRPSPGPVPGRPAAAPPPSAAAGQPPAGRRRRRFRRRRRGRGPGGGTPPSAPGSSGPQSAS